MSEKTPQEIAEQLLELEGVEAVDVNITMEITHRKRNTEVVDGWKQVRERVVDEEEFVEIAEENNLNYSGTIDVIGDFRLKDRMSVRRTYEKDE